MAEEILVIDHLTDNMVAAGALLVERLDQAGAEIKSAFWLYDAEQRSWKLIIASPLVGSLGPRQLYERIFAANRQATEGEKVLSLHNIEVRNTDNRLICSLNRAIHTDATISGIRLTRNFVHGEYIDDSYIYRSAL